MLRGGLCAALCALIVSCQPGGQGGVVRVVPQPLGGGPAPVATAAADSQSASAAVRPRISIDPADSVLQVMSLNLDGDPDEEQVIAVKRLGDVSAPVRVIIADSDRARGTYYYQSWESATNASDSRVFNLALRDLVGDHRMEIVATGMNDTGKLTLDVFRPLPPVQGKGLLYKPVCQLVADEISIEEADRPDSYSTDQKPGASFPIVAYLRDPDSENVMDLVRIRYTWNEKENRYVPGAAEKIPGEEVRQAQLKALYTSSGEDAFEQFISGSWVQVIPAKNGKDPDSYGAIIDFNTRNRSISLLSGNTQEAYIWRESQRTIYNRMRAIGENATVLQIRLIRTFSINVDSPSTITVEIIGNESGESPSATYTRVTEDIRAKLLGRIDSQVTMLSLSLTGRYLGAEGLSVSFAAPSLTWSDAGGQRSGTYVLFSLGGRPVITTRFHSEGRGRDQIGSWLVDYKERKEPQRTVRLLTLSPIHLTVSGYEEANGDTLSLQQEQNTAKK
jgi:hypothetical protein